MNVVRTQLNWQKAQPKNMIKNSFRNSIRQQTAVGQAQNGQNVQ